MICSNCGRENKGQAKFCIQCGTSLSGNEISSTMEKVDAQAPTVEDKSIRSDDNTVYKNENKIKAKVIGTILLSIVVIIAIFIGAAQYKSQNVSKKVIKKDLIGNKINIGSMNINIDKDNLKSIKLEKKVIETEIGIRTYQNKGIITLKDKNYKIELPINVMYIYNGRNRTWMLESNRIDTYSEKVKVDIKEKASEDIVKKAFIGEEINGIEITEEIADELIIESMEEEEHGAAINVFATLENKGNFITKNVNLQGTVSFDGAKWKLAYGFNPISDSISILTNPSAELTTDEIKKDLKMLVNNEKFTGYKGYTTINISLDDISTIKDITVDSITNTKGVSYIITGNIDGKSNNLIFDGSIKIKVSESGSVTSDANFNKVSVDNPTEEQIKEAVAGENVDVWIDKKYTSHLITDKDKKTLKVTEIVDYNNEPFYKHVYVNMTYTEQGKEITSDLIYIKMNYDASESKWTLSRIVSSTNPSFARSYAKNVINK